MLRVTNYQPFATNLKPKHFAQQKLDLSNSALVKKRALHKQFYIGGELLRPINADEAKKNRHK